MAARTKSSLASALSIAMADHGLGSLTVLKVGFLAPLTGKRVRSLPITLDKVLQAL